MFWHKNHMWKQKIYNLLVWRNIVSILIIFGLLIVVFGIIFLLYNHKAQKWITYIFGHLYLWLPLTSLPMLFISYVLTKKVMHAILKWFDIKFFKSFLPWLLVVVYFKYKKIEVHNSNFLAAFYYLGNVYIMVMINPLCHQSYLSLVMTFLRKCNYTFSFHVDFHQQSVRW